MSSVWSAERSLSVDRSRATIQASGARGLSRIVRGIRMPYTYHLELTEGAVPVVHAPRKVPVPQRAKVVEELERMEKLE